MPSVCYNQQVEPRRSRPRKQGFVLCRLVVAWTAKEVGEAVSCSTIRAISAGMITGNLITNKSLFTWWLKKWNEVCHFIHSFIVVFHLVEFVRVFTVNYIRDAAVVITRRVFKLLVTHCLIHRERSRLSVCIQRENLSESVSHLKFTVEGLIESCAHNWL